MERAYYEDTYKKNLECKVVKIEETPNNREVFFDRTIFYPECGGQPGDCGSFGPYKVLDTKKADNGDSIHIFEKNSPVKVGDAYNLQLNWAHRYKYMVMHTCQHMLSGLLFTEFGIGTVAVHLGEDYLTIETDKSKIDGKTLEDLVKIGNIKIKENHKILYHEMSHEDAEALGLRRSIKVDGPVRIVEIQDVDRIACGGVHVDRTSELRLLYYYSQEIIRGHVRLFFRCGDDAINYLLENSRILSEVSESLTCSPREVRNKLDTIVSEFTEMKMKLKNMEESLAKQEVFEKIENSIASFETNTETSSFVSACESFEDIALCVLNKNKWLIVLKGKFAKIDFNELRTTLLPLIDAKGGGRTPVFQGVGQNLSQKEKFLQSFKDLVKKA